ncbi:hypothetical protein NOV72_02857 [Caballeronia novacaledonica]|uniref:Uncharacterized protein n=1 Tax=Caballeronia novacaledonica TaxID=1544861 RepID=A0A2U3I6A9_9BURK|nr:hypothetical protein NOV72_02857 [Caballeronia novacaledonica]
MNRETMFLCAAALAVCTHTPTTPSAARSKAQPTGKAA